jgi:hypothetical protein
MSNENLKRKILRGTAGPEVEKALSRKESPLSISSTITALTQTFSSQAAESLEEDRDTPEHHVLETYASLDRLNHYLKELSRIVSTDHENRKKLDTPEHERAFQELLTNLQTIALRLNISWSVENRPEGNNPDFTAKHTLVSLLKELSRYVSAIQKTIEEKRGDFDSFCAPQCTDEAMELAAQSSQNLRRLSTNFAAGQIAVYPGDIEYEEEEYDKVLDQLSKMKNGNKLVKMFRLLAQNRSDILLGDPQIARHFSREEIRQFQLALYRTVANLTIGILDAVPAGPGEAGSWTADTLKIIKRFARRHQNKIKILKKIFPEWLDLTPDISITEALLSELTEIPTGGFIPSHLVFEFRKQFQADLPRMIAFLEKLAKVRARVQDEKNDHFIRVLGLDEEEDRELLKSLKGYLKS